MGSGQGGTSDGQILETRNIVIATGSEARMIPGLQPDARRILTNIEILDLREVPKNHGRDRRGCGRRRIRVVLPSLWDQSDGFRDVAADCAARGRRSLEGAGAAVQEKRNSRRNRRARRKHSEARQWRDVLGCDFANGKTENFDVETLLVAVGRKPKTENLGLEGTKVEMERGAIKVDEFQRTGEPGVYAIGDVVAGTPLLAHVATAEGMIAMAHIAGKPVTPLNKNHIPERDLHRAWNRQRGIDGSAGARGGTQSEDREISVRG